MIVTRQRRKTFPWRRVLLPLVAVALVAIAFAWQPSRNEIVNGPLAPVWRASAPMAGTIAAPFHFAAQNQAMTDLKHQILQLQHQVAAAQNASKSKDRHIARLRAQIAQFESQAANAKTAKPAVSSGSPIAAGSAAAGTGTSAQAGPTTGDLSAGATPDMRRTAQYWANMEPQNAAKVVQKLPPAYVARVMSLMSPDAAGAILDALPAAVAARLTQEHPELRR